MSHMGKFGKYLEKPFGKQDAITLITGALLIMAGFAFGWVMGMMF